jgi:hypothetical protein
MTFLYDKTGCKVNQKGARTRIITDKHFITIKTILQALSTDGAPAEAKRLT